MKTIYLLLSIMFFNIHAFCQVYTTQSKIEILEGHTWYAGKILEVKGDQYKIHYDRFNNDIWDIWVKKDRLRMVTSSQSNQAKINKKPASGIPKLYSGSSSNGSVYYVMYPSGHVAYGCPKGGLESFNYNSYCTQNSNNCGMYNKGGSSITITWNSGNSIKGTINKYGEFDIDGSLVAPVNMVPPKLSASYEFTINMSGMSVAETIKFKDDGTYEVNRSSGYDNNDGKNSAEWQSSHKGRYTINGYTLTLTDGSGKVTRYTVYSLDTVKNPESLGWDGNFLTRGK